MVSFSSLDMFITAALKSLCAKSNIWVLSKTVSVCMGPIACFFVCLISFFVANCTFPW